MKTPLTCEDIWEKLVSVYGPSGKEHAAAEVIRALAEPYADEITKDTMGSLIVRRKGAGKKIMLSAHMDQIGMIVTYIEDDGYLRFCQVGGFAPADLVNTPVRFENGTAGVVSFGDEKKLSELKVADMFIDIGAKNRAEAEKLVNVGDIAIYAGRPMRNGDTLIAPYMDNRIGCAALLIALSQIEETENDLYFVFSVQEEVGLRGAKTAAYAIDPDLGIAVDVTDTGDVPDMKYGMAVKLGEGPTVKLLDSSVICAPEVVALLNDTAKACAIPVQQEVLRAGGTDAGAIQLTRGGVPSGGVSIPTRYIHSACEMVSLTDVENAARLIAAAVVKSN